MPGQGSLLAGEMGESFTKQVASELERNMAVGRPMRAEDQSCESSGNAL